MHLRLERTCKLLLRNEGVGASLLRGPSFKRINIQQSVDKVDECHSVVHLCNIQISAAFNIRVEREHTAINLRLLHTLARHGVVANYLRKRCSREVFLAWLFFCVVFPRVLIHPLQSVRFPAKLVMALFEEFARLLAYF